MADSLREYIMKMKTESLQMIYEHFSQAELYQEYEEPLKIIDEILSQRNN